MNIAANKYFPIGVLLLFLSTTSCSTHQAAVKSEEIQSTEPTQKSSAYLIQAGDELDIKFFYNPELNETILVRPDGKISLQLVDEIQAAGMEPAELDDVLTQIYARELRKPVVTVIVRSFSAQRIYVGGEVRTQGPIDLRANMTALNAVVSAGGFMETAKPEKTIIIRKGPDNKLVKFQVDLANAIYGRGNGAGFQLQPYDVVYVPKSAIAIANKFIDQYIRGLIMFRGWSFGIGYEVNKIRF